MTELPAASAKPLQTARRAFRPACGAHTEGCSLHPREHLGAGGPAALHGRQGRQRLPHPVLRFADERAIHEPRERKRIRGDRSSGDDDRIARGPGTRFDGDAAQIQDRQHVGEGHLVAQREPDEVHLREGRAALQREQREARAAQLPLEVRVRREDPLADDAVERVDAIVEDVDREIRHPDLVQIGIRNRDAEQPRAASRHAAVLAAGVSPRPGYAPQSPLYCVHVGNSSR